MPIKVQHAQEAAELAGGLRWGAVLKMSYSFLQWSQTLSGHFVTEEGDLRCSEDTLLQVN
jgi:hypothetical protein